MAFDQSTRNRLQNFVSNARSLLTEEFTRQLQQYYGMDPLAGTVSELGKLTHIDESQLETARILRDTLEHYLASSPSGGTVEALNQIVREQAFTVLNRIAALRMAEARNICLESVGKVYNSKGFQLYTRLAGTALGKTGDAYRNFLFSVFDEFSMDLAVLFDRYSPMGRLFPREKALLELLDLVNNPEIEMLWAEDETIGWVYQYFNTKEERQKMRKESQAPRNSRELAVRNQFFTPRYVVEFLTDNTLGRIWYEMTQGDTGLVEQCNYLVRRPNEKFLNEGENAPEQKETDEELSQEELLKQPVYIPFRHLKDPREILLLDPACGSMHFGLYAFDLYEKIYDESWDLEGKLGPNTFIRSEKLQPLQRAYSSKEEMLKDVPRLIIENNIHGIDIDPRAAQIAGLSLWQRAHRSWQKQNIKPSDRPQIQRSNIVCAEPMPGEKELLKEFTGGLKPRVLGQLVEIIFEKMKLAGEAGSLLKIEAEIQYAIDKAQQEFSEEIVSRQNGEQTAMFSGMQEPKQLSAFDFSDLSSGTAFWEHAEQKILTALNNYAEHAEGEHSTQKRLFAGDAAKGFAFIDLCRKRYEVVVMNPPFGTTTMKLKKWLRDFFPSAGENLSVAFIVHSFQILQEYGYIGIISDLPWAQQSDYVKFRENIIENRSLKFFSELGWGILGTDVEVAASVFTLSKNDFCSFSNIVNYDDQSKCLKGILTGAKWEKYRKLADFLYLKNVPFAYNIDSELLQNFKKGLLLTENFIEGAGGVAASEADRVFRCWWEISALSIGFNKKWTHCQNGSPYSPFYYPTYFLILSEGQSFNTVKSYPNARTPNISMYGYPGLSYGKRTWEMYTYPLPGKQVITWEGQGLFPKPSNDKWHCLAFTNSALYSKLSNLVAGQHKYAGYLNTICFDVSKLPNLSTYAKDIYSKIRLIDELNEVSHSLSLEKIKGYALTNKNQLIDNFMQNEGEIAKLRSSLNVQVSKSLKKNESYETKAPSNNTYFSCLLDSAIEKIELIKIYLILLPGISYGRWDIRFATGEKQPPELPDPFDPLPVCPPGMLQNSEGLPAEPKDVPSDYPVRIIWNGIIVDDEGHPEDIVGHLREVMEVIWKEKAGDIEQEACEILKVKSIRDYFSKPSNFFADHLKRYSKSRRQAPIYWPLSTPSGSYTLWVYYHRLSDQILYTCINNFVEPKIKQVIETTDSLRRKTGRTSVEEKDLEKLSDLELELKDFRDELLRIAKFWKPNLNDGVQITAAPLWKLFQLKPWQKKLRETWQKLEKGDYDWAHLAYSIWPDRVREKCKTDKSLAIAHDLEDVYIEPPEKVKKKRKVAKIPPVVI